MESAPFALKVAALHDAYRLQPDRRGVAAIEDLGRLLGHAAEPVSVTFQESRWRLSTGDGFGRDLPPYPEFSDLLGIAVDRAKSLGMATRRLPIVPRGARFSTLGALEELRTANDRWKRGARDEAAILGSRALAIETFLTRDDAGLADGVASRALALLAIVRAASPEAAVREEALLALGMGYGRHAERLAARLDAGDPLRLFLANDTALSRGAHRESSEERRTLSVYQIARSGDPFALSKEIARLFPKDPPSGVLRAATNLAWLGQMEAEDIQGRAYLDYQAALLREAGAENEEQLEPKVSALAGDFAGPLGTADLVASVFRGPWHSRPTDRDEPPETRGNVLRPPQDFRGLRLGNVSGLRRALGGDDVPSGRPLSAALGPSLGAVDWLNSDRGEIIRRAKRFFDTRPTHLSAYAELIRYRLYDTRLGEELAKAFLRSAGVENGWVVYEAAYARDLERIRETLAVPTLGGATVAWVLAVWRHANWRTEDLRKEYERAVARFPTSWFPVNGYVELLRESGDSKREVELLEAFRGRVTDSSTPGYFHSHVKLAYSYTISGRADRSLEFLRSFEDVFAHRARSFALTRLGRFDEAEVESDKSVQGLADAETLAVRSYVLLRAGKIRQSAESFDRATKAYRSEDLVPEVILAGLASDVPADDVGAFSAALRERNVDRLRVLAVATAFAEKGLFASAIKAVERIEPPGAADFDLVVSEYQHRRRLNGVAQATKWLKDLVPPERRNPLSIKAVFAREPDILWDVIDDPSMGDHATFVWFLRALEAARAGTTPGRAGQLRRHFSTGSSPPVDVDRFLVGQDDEETFLRASAKAVHEDACQRAVCFASRLEGQGRFAEASDWYRVALEIPVGHSAMPGIAGTALRDYSKVRGGISAVAEASRTKGFEGAK